MSEFHTILTDVGKAKVANSALLNKKLILKTLKVGDGKGSYYNPSESQTDLVNEVYSCAISFIEVHPKNPNWIIAIGIIPGSIGGFYIREVGLFDDEGDMVAIGKYPESYKPSLDDGATNDLRIRTIFEVSNVDSITLEVNPSVIFATKEDINNLQEQITRNDKDIAVLSNPNLLINGNFKNPVNQRGAVTQNKNCFVCDRYDTAYVNASNTFNCTFDDNGMKLIMTSDRESYFKPLELIYPVESGIIIPLRGKKITLSLKVHEISNLEKINPFLNYFFSSNKNSNRGCGTDRIEAGDAKIFNVENGVISYVITVPDNASMMSIRFGLMCMNDLNSSNSYEVNGEYGVFEWIKLEIGDKATPFVPRSYGEELALCKRYYQEIHLYGEANAKNALPLFQNYPIEMRTKPSYKLSSNSTNTGDIKDKLDKFGTGTVDIGTYTIYLDKIALIHLRTSEDKLEVNSKYRGLVKLDAEVY